MNATIKSENGRSWIECFYDPIRLDWNEAIRAAYAVLGIKPGKLKVVCSPSRHTTTHNNQLIS
jgi:hypothetical protein